MTPGPADLSPPSPAGRAAIAVLATTDTKLAEAVFLRDRLRGHGWPTRIVDVGLGLSADPPEIRAAADVPAEVVAAAAGHDLAALRRARRDVAMADMAAGAAHVLARWCRDGELAGVIGVGGNQGTAVSAGAIRDLPYGLPKLIVSTVASGDVRGFVGDSDIAMLFSVGDLLGGPNQVTGGVLRQAAAAVAGMAQARWGDLAAPRPRPVVAVTAFGNTHGAVTAAMRQLAAAGVDAVPFHASGASGSAMERLVDAGEFDGVLDLTTHELLGELFPDDSYAPVRPGRLTAAGRRGIPQIVAPGGLEYHCFGAAETIPARLRGRPTHHHNPHNTNVRATAGELRVVAEAMADRLGAATGPAAVLVPLRGWSQVGSPGGVLHDPKANAALVGALRRLLPRRVALRELDCTINDPMFAGAATRTLLEFLTTVSGHAGQTAHVPHTLGER